MENNAITNLTPTNPLEAQCTDFFTTMDLSLIENKKLLLKAITQPDINLTDYLDKPFKIVDCYIEPCTIDTDSGPITSNRLILFDENGTSYSTVSVGIINSIQRMLIITPDISDFRVKVVQIKTKKGFRTFSLIPE